ncbi:MULTISPECIES: ABC transporter ATP-binding protein [unclassified Pseudofrankia]|uniref:ABC transporter ATP-binding protein n=1 Tax=unclassified Pseudofrankia TaxID=2994372 RepID=UPI001F522AAC|nr:MULTISPECIES: ATP-binding cassette domain-containing protein [unclassified Pseudofrankia]MDT3439681.1 ATP-binding cassette domain-containing protein [Pseudofrankia sp. BMG5.37]
MNQSTQQRRGESRPASPPARLPVQAAAGPASSPGERSPAEDADPAAVDVRGLSKRYGRRTVVNDLDLRIPVGAVAGFIGPNGAGKTTTLRMLLGLVRPTTGQGTVLGRPLTEPAGYLPRVGALIESPALYPRLSARRNLEALAILAGQYHPTWIEEVLDEVGLGERADDEVRSYSLGMKQRLAIAAALLGDPDLLVLDEPTNGLDPMGIRLMRELIRDLAVRDSRPRTVSADESAAGRGSAIVARPRTISADEFSAGRGSAIVARPRTVIVSSHLLAEVEQICDWIIVVDRGELAYQGPPDGLLSAGAARVTLRPEHLDDLGMLADLAAGLGLKVERAGDLVTAVLPSGGAPGRSAQPPAPGTPGSEHDDPQHAMHALLGDLNRAAHAHGITLVEIAPSRVTLEERYTGLVAQGAGRLMGDAA